MGYREDKEKEELEKLYPAGSKERNILDYSGAHHDKGDVPPMLYSAFKVLMGISVLMAVVTLVAYFTSY